jgi:hypothetical protein
MGLTGPSIAPRSRANSRIVSHGVAGGTGPAWFEVHTKSGQVMWFGNSTDSQVVFQGTTIVDSWALTRITDSKGNYYTVSHNNDPSNGVAYPSRIDYTGNGAAGVSPYNSVRFVYASRSDIVPTYRAGSVVRVAALLSEVQTYFGSSLVSDYRFAYATSPSTQRSRLSSVTVCDGSGSCLPATTFTWQNAGQPFTNPNVWIASFGNVAATGGFDLQSNYPRYLADVNGDGLQDVVGIAGANIYVSLNSGSGFAAPQLWLACSFTVGCGGWPTQSLTSVPASCNGVSCVGATNGSYPRFVMDMNGDGRADILGIGATAIYVSLGTGSSFTAPQTWLNCSFTANCADSGFTDDNV